MANPADHMSAELLRLSEQNVTGSGETVLGTTENSRCVAHNPEVTGSNPVPATQRSGPGDSSGATFVVFAFRGLGDDPGRTSAHGPPPIGQHGLDGADDLGRVWFGPGAETD